MEAKFAYQERKAEIVAERRAKSGAKHDKDLRRAVTDLRIEDSRSDRSTTSRRRSSHRPHDSERQSRPDGLGRHYSSSSTGSARERRDHSTSRRYSSIHHHHHPRSPYAESETSHHSHSAPTSPNPNRHSLDLVRRRTDTDLAQLTRNHQARPPLRSISTTAVDMDLAYGDYHPSSIAPFTRGGGDEKELFTLVSKVRLLLDEANCAQHSVKAMIEHLQKNPDAMAAVALTLAEISNLASKMAPGVLTALKGSAPAVFALLASPQFLIAAGVGIGVTVVMLGGYKIIKKIKARNAAAKEGSMDEMMEIDGEVDLGMIDKWRRGIEVGEGEAASVGTSVDGEFITPLAASMRGMETREDLREGPLTEKERKKREKKEKRKEGKEIKERKKMGKKRLALTTGSEGGSEMSEGPTGSRRSSSSKLGTSIGGEARKALVKVKKPSPLRRLLA